MMDLISWRLADCLEARVPSLTVKDGLAVYPNRAAAGKGLAITFEIASASQIPTSSQSASV